MNPAKNPLKCTFSTCKSYHFDAFSGDSISLVKFNSKLSTFTAPVSLKSSNRKTCFSLPSTCELFSSRSVQCMNVISLHDHNRTARRTEPREALHLFHDLWPEKERDRHTPQRLSRSLSRTPPIIRHFDLATRNSSTMRTTFHRNRFFPPSAPNHNKTSPFPCSAHPLPSIAS